MIRKYFYYYILFCFLTTGPLWATSTGLNNIPTADVVPENVLVYQFISDMANNNKPDYVTGFKYGLMKNVEIGLDGRIFPEKAKQENLVVQGKLRFELTDFLAIAGGITNLGDRSRAGKEFPFGVLSQDFGFLRGHFGGSIQNNNEGFFGGIDKTLKFLNRDLTLRSDIIQTNDQHETTTSAGFIYDLGHNFLVESWMSFPTESGKEDVLTIKLNYVIKF
ncbi:MAG: hypothetical protein FVQ84_06770 [Planctomycetes bacterium]|nr:hypothetical protein [Planctomycetota bacterium]